MEHEVGVLLGHGADLRNVMPHHHVQQGEVRRGAVRQVTHRQPGRLAAVLVNLARGGGGGRVRWIAVWRSKALVEVIMVK